MLRACRNKYQLDAEKGILYTEDNVPVYTLHLSNIPTHTTKYRLNLYFSQFGVVKLLRIARKAKKVTTVNETNGIGFVTFERAECAAKTLTRKHTSISKLLRIKPAKTWEQPKFAQQMRNSLDGSTFDVKNKECTNSAIDADGKFTVMALNDDCLRHIFSFLDQYEVYKLAFVCQRFHDLFGNMLQSKKLFEFDVCEFTPMEIRQIFSKFGKYIRRLRIDALSDPEDQSCSEYFAILSMYCQDLEFIQITCSQGVHHDVFKRIFQTSGDQLKSVIMEGCDLNDAICKQFEYLSNLKTLSLCYSDSITGKYLNSLSSVENLNLRDCKNLESSNFMDICKAIKLKTLNIVGCSRLIYDGIETLVKTQTNLEDLSIDSSFITLHKIIQLKRLKHIRMYRNGDDLFSCQCLLKKLAEKGSERIETLELFGVKLLSNNSDRQRILKLTNLKRLTIVREKYLDDEFLLAASKACPKLEELNFARSLNLADDGILDLVQNLKHLKFLNISYNSQFTDYIVHEIHNILEKRQKEQSGSISKLTLCVYQTSIKLEKHKNTKFLKLSDEIDDEDDYEDGYDSEDDDDHYYANNYYDDDDYMDYLHLM